MAINTGYRAIPANTQRVEYNTELVQIKRIPFKLPWKVGSYLKLHSYHQNPK